MDLVKNIDLYCCYFIDYFMSQIMNYFMNVFTMALIVVTVIKNVTINAPQLSINRYECDCWH